jgi:hypothetical protein
MSSKLLSESVDLACLEAVLREADRRLAEPEESGFAGLARVGGAVAAGTYWSLDWWLRRAAEEAARSDDPNRTRITQLHGCSIVARQRYTDLHLFLHSLDQEPVRLDLLFPNEPLLHDHAAFVVDLPGGHVTFYGVRIDLRRRRQMLFAFAALAILAATEAAGHELEELMARLGYVPMRKGEGLSDLSVLVLRLRRELEAGLAGHVEPMPNLHMLIEVVGKDRIRFNIHPDLVDVKELPRNPPPPRRR